MPPTQEDMFYALAGLAMAGVSAGTHAMRLLANRGLVSPDDVEEFADSLTQHFAGLGDAADGPMASHVRELLDARLAAPLAEIRETAKRTWIGRDRA